MKEDLYLLWIVDEKNRVLYRNMNNNDSYNPIYDQLVGTIQTTRITNSRQLYSALFKLEESSIAGICLCEPSKENPDVILASFHYDPHLEKVMLGMFDQLPDLVVILDESMLPVYASKEWINLLGTHLNELTPEHYESIINTSAPDTFPKQVHEAIAKRYPISKQTVGFFTEEKQTVFLELSGVPFNDVNGVPLYSLIARQVDDQYMQKIQVNHQLEWFAAMLESQNQQLRSTNEQLTDKIYEQNLIQDITRSFIRFNTQNAPLLLMGALSKLHSYFVCSNIYLINHGSPNLKLGSPYVFNIDQHSDDFLLFQRKVNEALVKHGLLHLTKEANIHQKDEHLLILPISQKGEITHWLWMESSKEINVMKHQKAMSILLNVLSTIMVRYRKILELNQANIENKLILDYTPTPNIMFKLDSHEVIVSKAFYTLTGYTEDDMDSNMYISVLKELISQRVLSDGTSTDTFEYVLKLKNGTDIPIIVSYFHNIAEHVIYISLADIREQKQRELELKTANERMNNLLNQTLLSLANIVDVVDPYNSSHQKGVANLCAEIATRAQFGKDDVQAAYYAGLLHDIGKLYVPTEILNKPAKLNAIEYQLVQTHSTYSYEILKHIDFPWPIADIILYHHERMDGSGYPKGLKGEMIPALSRILALADTIESMATHKPYRTAFTQAQIIAELNLFAHQFDSTYLTIALNLLETVELSTFLTKPA